MSEEKSELWSLDEKEIIRLQEVCAKLISGHSPVKVHSDYWVIKENGEYREMTVEEQMEYSK